MSSTQRRPRLGANPPTLSFTERDRRWARTRDLMRKENVDFLLVAGFRAREMYESYLADDYNEGCVLFPLEGKPIVITWAPLRVKRAQWSNERGHKLWIDDYRVAVSGGAVAQLVQEMGFADARLGIVGLRSQAPTEQYGAIPAGFWLDFVAGLPKAQMRDISEEYSHLMLVKSDEELAQMRYAAAAAEAGCKVIADIAEVGIGEEELFAEATAEMLRYGIGLRYPMIVMNSGPATLSWGPPRWTTRGEAPRTMQRGDLMQCELMPLCGNQEAQVQMTVAFDPIDDMNVKCERIATASMEAGLKYLKPGITFAELTGVMEEPLKTAGCWGWTPLVHSVGPHFLNGSTTINREGLDLGVRFAGPPRMINRKAVVEAGMVFAFEPNACLGEHRVNIGGTVIVTPNGCESLNEIPCRVTHK